MIGIVEGLAEFYSFGPALSGRRDEQGSPQRNHRKSSPSGGADIKHLREGPSRDRSPARAVVLLDELDKEIRHKTKGDASAGRSHAPPMVKRKVSLADLRAAAEEIMGKPLSTLRSPLVN